MPSGKVTPELVEKWEELHRSLSYREIERLYGISDTTVAYWLDPKIRKRWLEYDRQRRLKQKEKNLRIKNYQKEYRKRPEVKLRYKEQRKNYDLKYKNLVRHIDSYFPQIFNSNPELPLFEISSRIDNLSGIHLKESTLETLVNKYVAKARDPPLIKTESGQYRLNPSFYGN